MTSKCIFFDRGFCKNKSKCPLKHPSQDCQGECEDIKTCPKRHRVQCKNGTTCIFLVSRSCEFLHTDALGEEIKTSEVDILKKLISANGVKINVLEEKLLNLERVLNESAQNVNVLETKLCKKIEILEVKVAALEGIPVENLKEGTYLEESEKVEVDKTENSDGFNCDICIKVLKSKANLTNHDKKYHMVKGRNLYKCDNCNEKFDDKPKLKYHITKEHIGCTICQKIFPTITSLNNHITAVHDKLNTKHQIEKEPSLRLKKVQKS